MMKSYFIHLSIATGLLLVAMFLANMIKQHYSTDALGGIALLVILAIGILFSIFFAWLQIELENSYLSTGGLIVFSGVVLVLQSYIYHFMTFIKLAHVALVDILVKSDLLFWLTFLLPFMGAMYMHLWRFKQKAKQH